MFYETPQIQIFLPFQTFVYIQTIRQINYITMRNFKSYQLSLETFSEVRGGKQISLDETPKADLEEGAKPWYGKEDR